MRIVKPAVLITLFVSGALAADFSGTWKMDPARSESAHQDVPTGPSTVSIELNGSVVTIETTRSESGKPAAFHEKLTYRLDGVETTGQGDSGVAVTCRAHRDGDKLVVETVRNVENSTVTTVYVHSLSPGGREMTIDKTLTIQHGYQGVATAPNTGHGKDTFVRVSKKDSDSSH